jgi:hypothetical protein
MGDPRILGPLRQIAEQIANSIRRITRELTSDRFIKFFSLMAKESARNIPLLTTIAIKVARIFSVIAQAASPALRKFLEFFDDLVTKGDEATGSKSGLSRLQRFFLRGEEMAESFAKLTGAVIGLFAALAGAGAADTGQSAVDQLTEQIKKATDWVNENKDKVRQFFKDSLDASKAIASAVFAIGKALAIVFDSKAVEDFARVFKDVFLPAITDAVIALGAFTQLFVKFLDLPVVGELARFALSVLLIHKAFSTFFKLLGPFSARLVLLLGRIPLLGIVVRAFAASMRVAIAVMGGPWGILIAAIIAGIVILDRKFHFIQPVIHFLGKTFKDTFENIKVIVSYVAPIVAHFLEKIIGGAFKFVKGVLIDTVDSFLGAFTQIAGAISSIASAASKLPFVGDKFKSVAEAIDKGRDVVDKYRESLRKMNEEHGKAPSRVERLQNNVADLTLRLSRLKTGTTEYRQTAEKLRGKQSELNIALADAEQKGKKGARGPRAIGRSAESAAIAVDKANTAITKGFNQLAEQLGGIKKITYTTSGVTVHGGKSDITADTGDITAGRAMGGWMGGQAGGPQGPDDLHVLAGKGEAFLNVGQQGPVEEGLALRSMFMGGPGSLTDLFRQSGGALFAAGGFVDKVKSRANRLAAMHLPYRWGGGHGVGTIDDKEAAGGLDCSGAVGYALGIPARHSSGYASLGRGGDRGQVVVYSNAEHTFMRILGRFFGTSGFGHPQAGPGAAWFTVPPSTTYLKGFVARSMGANDIGSGAGLTGLGDIGSPRIQGPAGLLRTLAQRAVTRATRAANRKLGSSGDATGQGLSDAGALVNAGQIRNWIRAGLRVAGQRITSGAIATLLGRIMQESSGNPNAINKWDANFRRGDPSKGILQTTGATFGRYKVPGHGNIFNPVDNIAAAVRYMLATYHRLVGRSSTGYQTGGFVGGRPTGRSYTTPAVFNTSFQGILAELRRAQDVVGAIKTRGTKFVKRFSRSFDQIFGENGLLDQGSAAVQRAVDVMALKLRQATFQVTRSGTVIRRLTPEQQNLAQLQSIDQQRQGLRSLRGIAAGSLRDVDRRLELLKRGGVTDKERKTYETLVAARRALVEKILGLDQAIADAVEARFNAQEQIIQDAIDKIDATASKTIARADLADRVANVIQGLAGQDQNAFALRGAALQARSGAIISQRDQLTKASAIAGALGRQDIVQQLIARIEDLNVQLFENAAAIRSNTVAARQAQIDAITSRGGFLGGVSGGLTSILQTIGARTGTLDVAGLKDLGQQAGTTLKQTGDALRQQLGETFGINLLGAYGTSLVDLLKTIDFDQIESGMSVEQRTQFEGLINAIIDNGGAVEQNTQALQDLTQTQEQTWSSSAWQIFRQAIFTGSGGLLPQYAVPLMASGGSILSDGLLYGHQGERIMPAQVNHDQSWEGGDTNNIYITSPTEVADPGHIARVLSFHRSLNRAT